MRRVLNVVPAAWMAHGTTAKIPTSNRRRQLQPGDEVSAAVAPRDVINNLLWLPGTSRALLQEATGIVRNKMINRTISPSFEKQSKTVNRFSSSFFQPLGLSLCSFARRVAILIILRKEQSTPIFYNRTYCNIQLYQHERTISYH